MSDWRLPKNDPPTTTAPPPPAPPPMTSPHPEQPVEARSYSSGGWVGPEGPYAVNQQERGRKLTEQECRSALADRQTPLRHGTADLGWEVADRMRDLFDELRAARASVALDGGGWLVPATAKGTAIDEDEWGRTLYVFTMDEPHPDAASVALDGGLAEALRAVGWWPDLDVEDYDRLAAQLRAALRNAPPATPEPHYVPDPRPYGYGREDSEW